MGAEDGVETIAVLKGDPLYAGFELTGQKIPLEDVRLLAPVIPRSKVVCVGKNYAAHALEMAAILGGDGKVPDEPLVFLEGDPAFYSRLGFVAGGRLGFTAPSVRIPPLAFQVWTAPSYSGGVSGALVYPDVFWRHDAVGLRP